MNLLGEDFFFFLFKCGMSSKFINSAKVKIIASSIKIQAPEIERIGFGF